MSQESIIDASRPNAGRIYDYLLGGSHNFEVDRHAAERVKQLIPFLPKTMRLQRWCLQDLAVELTKNRGYELIIDFASGLPTNDHIHHVVPSGTTVIYSDYDPVVVEYAHEILADTPNVYFYHADLRRPDELLNRHEVQQLLNGRRNVGLVLWGVAAFVADDELSSAARYLYDWAGPDACLAFNAQAADVNMEDPAMVQAIDMYRQMGSPMVMRTLKRYGELLLPWKTDEKGFIAFLDWHGIDRSELTEKEKLDYGPGGGGYGAYMHK